MLWSPCAVAAEEIKIDWQVRGECEDAALNASESAEILEPGRVVVDSFVHLCLVNLSFRLCLLVEPDVQRRRLGHAWNPKPKQLRVQDCDGRFCRFPLSP